MINIKLKIFVALACYLFVGTMVAATTVLSCGKHTFKINQPLVGFKKIYIKNNENWRRLKPFDISEKDYRISNIDTLQSRCNENLCKVNVIISKDLVGDRHLPYIIQSNSNYCKIDGFNIDKFLIQEDDYDCYKRKNLDSLEKGYCKIIKQK